MPSMLVIERDEVIRGILIKGLSKVGHEVISAYDGASGIKVFQIKPFDIALVDMDLPDLRSFDIVSDLRRLSPDTQIIAMSPSERRLYEALDHGAVATLRKPFMIGKMNEVVQGLLGDGATAP